jgi:ubiquinone/menaquinone biosynthesis C-methylase UbiE
MFASSFLIWMASGTFLMRGRDRSIQAFTPQALPFIGSYDQQPLADITWYSGSAGRHLIELIISGRINRGAIVVDVGCGPGTEAMFLSRQGMFVVGVDLSLPALRKAVAIQDIVCTRCAWVQADGLALPLSDCSADVVNDSFFFHNVRDAARDSYASEVFRVLKPGGLLIIRGFSDWMSPGSGPRRLTSDDLTSTFLPGFILDHLERFRNLPTETRPDQWHWLSLWKRRAAPREALRSLETASPHLP